MKTRTFKMDKEKWRLISINDWENLEGLVPIVADDPKLRDRKVHRRGIQQGLESSVFIFPECTASLLGPRLQNVFCKYWHLRKWHLRHAPQLLFSTMRNVGKISCHEVSLDWTFGPGRGQCSVEPLPLVYHCSFPRDDYHSLCLNKLSFVLTETVIFPAINSSGQLEFTKSCFFIPLWQSTSLLF